MSLIKSSAGETSVRRWLPAAAAPPVVVPVEPVDPFAGERAELRRQIEALLAERDGLAGRLRTLEEEVPAAVAKAEAAAYLRGLDAAESRAQDALARLEQSLARALTQIAADEMAIERLAIRIARVALGKILAAPDDPAALVEGAIRRQLATLDADMLLRIEVSAADFPSPEGLAALARAIGEDRLEVSASGALRSGDCRLKLRLGELEIGAPQQWARLGAIFDDLAEERAS